MRFTLTPDSWYAMELIGEEFGGAVRSCSPILVTSVTPLHAGDGRFELAFYHANYPEGLRNKVYSLQTIERVGTFLLARSLEHRPVRVLLIFEISWEWLVKEFGVERGVGAVEEWLGRNA